MKGDQRLFISFRERALANRQNGNILHHFFLKNSEPVLKIADRLNMKSKFFAPAGYLHPCFFN
jgi:hypothetical protein